MGAYEDGVLVGGSITASTIAADSIGSSELAATAVAEIADGAWDEATSGHATAGSTGKALIDVLAFGAPPTAAAVANAILDEVLDTDHDTAQTLGGGAWRLAIKTIAYDGQAGNGAVGTVDVFDVSGDVEIMSVYAKCTESLVGAATLAWGGVNGSFTLAGTVVDAESIDAGEWSDGGTGFAAGSGTNLITSFGLDQPFAFSESIIQTIGVTDITDGTIVAYCWWRPLSAGATLGAA